MRLTTLDGTKMTKIFKYQVVTDVSSLEDPKKNDFGEDILFETNNFQIARKECIEWADFDDIVVRVRNKYLVEKFKCNGYAEANSRYPKTVENSYR